MRVNTLIIVLQKNFSNSFYKSTFHSTTTFFFFFKHSFSHFVLSLIALYYILRFTKKKFNNNDLIIAYSKIFLNTYKHKHVSGYSEYRVLYMFVYQSIIIIIIHIINIFKSLQKIYWWNNYHLWNGRQNTLPFPAIVAVLIHALCVCSIRYI